MDQDFVLAIHTYIHHSLSRYTKCSENHQVVLVQGFLGFRLLFHFMMCLKPSWLDTWKPGWLSQHEIWKKKSYKKCAHMMQYKIGYFVVAKASSFTTGASLCYPNNQIHRDSRTMTLMPWIYFRLANLQAVRNDLNTTLCLHNALSSMASSKASTLASVPKWLQKPLQFLDAHNFGRFLLMAGVDSVLDLFIAAASVAMWATAMKLDFLFVNNKKCQGKKRKHLSGVMQHPRNPKSQAT